MMATSATLTARRTVDGAVGKRMAAWQHLLGSEKITDEPPFVTQGACTQRDLVDRLPFEKTLFAVS